jgi:hypothetical protein
MEKIRGKSLKEWKYYSDKDNIPIRTQKYIIVLEERIEQLILSGVSQQRELLFCGGCGNKRQLIVETDINSQRVCKNKLCQQNNCG